jgi:clan AA aspartic protease (TIGR02281 family)
MTSSRRFSLIGCVALLLAGVSSHALRAADAPVADPLKEAGLTKVGTVYVLPDETAVLDGVKTLKATKVAADKETKSRKVIETQIATKRKVIKDAEKEYEALENRLSVITDVGVHNRMVTRMNRMVVDHKEATTAIKDLEEQANKVSSTAKNKFVDDLAKLKEKADAVEAKYQPLASDAGVKAAIAKLATQKVTLGPSAEFTAAIGDLKKWASEVDSEAIPMRDDNGIHVVDVLLNGEHFMMEVDTGATGISLPAEIAEKLKMIPGEQDPTVKIQLANGSLIEGRAMTIKSVRVGRFTVEDVSCVVLEKGLPNVPALLGGSYLNHFIVKLDPAANELRLTAIKETAPAKPSR